MPLRRLDEPGKAGKRDDLTVITRNKLRAAGPLLLPLLAPTVSACPLCDTETGREVRAGLFANDFGMTLLSVLAPFPVLLLLVAALHCAMRRFGKASTTSKQPGSDLLHPHEYRP